MGSKHTTVYDVVDILDAYNYLRNNGMTKVTPKNLFDYCPVQSVGTIRKVLDIYEALLYNCPIDSSKYSDKMINSVKLYRMCKSAPKYINAWRKMELLDDPDSVKSAAHILSKGPNAWSVQQYRSIHKVFSYTRDGKINDGVPNDNLHHVATAYFKLVSPTNNTNKFKTSTKRARNNSIDYDKAWEDCQIYNDFEVAKIHSCGRCTATKIRHIYKAIRDNTPIAACYSNQVKIINAAMNYFNNNNYAVNTTVPPTSVDSTLPAELIELLNIEDELNQLKVKENQLLVKKDALIVTLKTLANN